MLVCLSLCGPARVGGQRPPFFFYTGLTYGSQAAYHPLAAMLNSGFYNFQMDNRGDDPFDLAFDQGVANVVRNLAHPWESIRAYGWRDMLTSEILPNMDPDRGQWVPNYFGHVLGEGLVFRMSREWYQLHQVPHPQTMAILSTLAGALINESIENGSFEGPNVDPIVDLYVFNPIGIALFSSDRVAGFASRRLGMAYWPLQIAFDPAHRTIENAGYRTAFRIPVAARGRLGLFLTYGVQSLAGVSWRFPGDYALAMGGGAAASRLVDLGGPGEARRVTATTGPAFGLFLDRKRSLLASVVVTPEKHEVLAVNVYPGWLGSGSLRPGVSIGWDAEGNLRWSLHIQGLPLGLGQTSGRPADRPN